MANIVKEAKTKGSETIAVEPSVVKGTAKKEAAAPQQSASLFNAMPTKGSGASKGLVKKSYKTSLKGAVGAGGGGGMMKTDSNPFGVTKAASLSPKEEVAATTTPADTSSSATGARPILAVPGPKYSAKSAIMGGGSDNAANVPVKKSFAKSSYKSSGGNKMASSSSSSAAAPGGTMKSNVGVAASPSGEHVPHNNSQENEMMDQAWKEQSSSSSSTVMKGSIATAPSTPSSSTSGSPKSYSKSSFKKSGSGKGAPGGWAVSSSPIEASTNVAASAVAAPKQAAPVSSSAAAAPLKGEQANALFGGGQHGGPVKKQAAVKKGYGKSSFKASLAASGGSGGMLKESIGGAFLSGFEQTPSNAAVLLPKQDDTPQTKEPEETAPSDNDQAQQQVQQVIQAKVMPNTIGQFGSSAGERMAGGRIGSAYSPGRGVQQTSIPTGAGQAGNVNQGGGRQQQQQQMAQPAAQGGQSAVAPQKEMDTISVTITDPRTGKKRTITTTTPGSKLG